MELANKLSQRIEISNFFSKSIDPIFGPMISFLISIKSHNPLDFIKKYLEIDIETNREVLNTISKSVTMNSQEYFLVYLLPILSKLLRLAAIERPENVRKFLLNKLHLIKDIPTHDTESSRPSSSFTETISLLTPMPRLSTSSSTSQVHSISNKGKLDHMVTPRPFTGRVRAKIDEALELEKAICSQQIEIQKEQVVISRNGLNKYSIKPLDVRLLVLGLAGSGKSTLINLLQGIVEKTTPTVGFRPATLTTEDGCTKLKLFDLGGGDKIRGIWSQYYHDVHGFMFMLDGSMGSDEIEKAVLVLRSVCDHPFMTDKPFILLVNKWRITQSSLSLTEIQSIIDDNLGVHSQSSCGSNHINNNRCHLIPFNCDLNDPMLEEGLDQLLHSVRNQQAILYARVEKDSHVRRIADSQRRLEREKRVLKIKIAQAFHSYIAPDILQDLDYSQGDDMGSLNEDAAVKFLASEIGIDSTTELPPQAITIVSLLGRQRIALQIVGSMYVPINKSRNALSWTEILNIVIDLREELGLRQNIIL